MNYDSYLSPELVWAGVVGLILWLVSHFIYPNLRVLRIKGLYEAASFNSRITFFFILFLGTLSWVLISIALMKPIKYYGSLNREVEARDIMFVVDVSRSMLAIDYTPNRLEVAKKNIKSFIRKRGNDRLGLIMFAEKVITLSPSTFDQLALLEKVNDIEVSFLGNGTNIGDAVALGVERLAKLETKEKILILLTDGVSNVGNVTPLQASTYAQENEIKIYAVGLGSDKDAVIPYYSGGRQYFQKIPGGSIDESVLKKMSKDTNGEYFYAKSEKTLENVFEQINKLEKSKVNISDAKKYTHFYKTFLFFGIFFLMLTEFLIMRTRLLGV